MKIVHYIPTLSPSDGGTATYMQQLADTLGKVVELHIVTHRTAEQLAVRHAVVHHLSGRNWCALRREYRSLLTALNPDVVHVNCCWKPMFAFASVWAHEAGYPVVLSPHGMLEPWIVNRHYWTRKVPSLLLWQRKALLCASIVHSTAETEAWNLRHIDSYCPLLRGWKPKVQVIANGIDLSSITMRSEWKSRKSLLFLSRIHPKKGIELLLPAFARLSAPGAPLDGYTLKIAGDGDKVYISHLKQLAMALNVSASIEWLGGVYGDAKLCLLREADLFVLPTYSENFGLVIAEALACGTPVLTTTGTPWKDVFAQTGCGWCVDADEAAIEEALCNFAATDNMMRRSMGESGRKLIEGKFDSWTVAKQFVDMYRSLC